MRVMKQMIALSQLSVPTQKDRILVVVEQDIKAMAKTVQVNLALLCLYSQDSAGFDNWHM